MIATEISPLTAEKFNELIAARRNPGKIDELLPPDNLSKTDELLERVKATSEENLGLVLTDLESAINELSNLVDELQEANINTSASVDDLRAKVMELINGQLASEVARLSLIINLAVVVGKLKKAQFVALFDPKDNSICQQLYSRSKSLPGLFLGVIFDLDNFKANVETPEMIQILQKLCRRFKGALGDYRITLPKVAQPQA